MASPPGKDDKDETNWNWEKWLTDTFTKETDERLIEDANKSVDEELRVDFSSNIGLDNEVVNIGRDPTPENEVTTGVSQSSEEEAAGETSLETNEVTTGVSQCSEEEPAGETSVETSEVITGVSQSTEEEPAGETSLETNEVALEQPQSSELSAQSPEELPAFVTKLLKENESCNLESGVITEICTDSNKGARTKALPGTSEVKQQSQCHEQLSQPPAKLPSFIEGLLENDACSSGKRKAECSGNSKSKKKGCETPVNYRATKEQFENEEKDDKKKREKKLREQQRSKNNRDKKKQLDAQNEAERLSLGKEVDDLKNQNAAKDKMVKVLKLQVNARDSGIVHLEKKVERLEQEKDLEIVYLQKKVERLEQEKDLEIVHLKKKVERLEQEKDLEIVYLQKKIKRLELETEERDAEIILLKNKLEYQNAEKGPSFTL